MLEECIKTACYFGDWALDIGTGSGLILDLLSEKFQNVVGCDIDFDALKYCKSNLRKDGEIRRRAKNIMLVCCDGAFVFRGIRFDLVVTNPPYLPDNEKQRGQKDTTVDGGLSGLEATFHIVKSALPLLTPEGRLLVVISSLADQSQLNLLTKELNAKFRSIMERKLFFENLSVVEFSRI